MRGLLGTWLCCIAAGCASTPPAGHGPTVDSHAETAAVCLEAPELAPLSMCVGVEYLPPTTAIAPKLAEGWLRPTLRTTHCPAMFSTLGHAIGASDLRRQDPTVEPAQPIHAAHPVRRQANEDEPTFWQRSESELAEICDPVERTTLMFLRSLMGEDRRRMQRELGMPLLATQHMDVSARLLESLGDPHAEEDQARYMSRNGHRLLERPLRRALKNSTFIRDIELAVEDFKADHVFTSHAYQEHNEGGLDWGHVSMRVHPTKFSDPLEMTYKLRGLRVGTSSTKLKLGWTEHLSDTVSLHLRTRQNYGEGHVTVRADLVWEVSESTTFAVVAGDDLDFLASSDAYSFFESPMDGAPGILVYAQTIF